MCPDCTAGPAWENVRVAGGMPYEIWHTFDCPEWAVMQKARHHLRDQAVLMTNADVVNWLTDPAGDES
ncbi:hypothetical protein GPA10_09430 [Streptomyces sp. p1417]|uniref:Uncharacterized protein n=1 Tax=Streptomyces typhae TaxID=2681492 RepID=A0A6L6WU03_9ACTN|nr:hypothetical protein [Streptomyces typhae]MVO84978.1 hypothetical protein [Streptomyces typhae]